MALEDIQNDVAWDRSQVEANPAEWTLITIAQLSQQHDDDDCGVVVTIMLTISPMTFP